MRNLTKVMAFSLVLASHFNSFAQCACTSCDFVIDPSQTSYFYTSSQLKGAMGVSDLSGKKICIKMGTYNKKVAFKDIEGSPSNYILITNCDGLVTINAPTSEAIQLYNAKYVRLLGNGCSQFKYGIRATSQSANHVEAKDLEGGRIPHIEIAHLNIGGQTGLVGSAGLKIIDQPGCDADTLTPRTNPNRWVIRNISVHDNYIHNVGTEGIYIGKRR